MKTLIVEDDADIAELVEYNLRQERFVAEVAASGATGLIRARKLLPDLIILDLMLPDMGGLDVCRILKSDDRTRAIPILMLTAKGEEVDRLVGFEVGADDYLAKPFSPRELVLRAKAILRRVKEGPAAARSAPVTFGCLAIDPQRYHVAVDEAEIRLTAIEFKLLHYLLTSKGRVATRDILLDQVWGYEAALTTRTVDTHVKRLREKLGRAAAYLETIRGIGYRWKERAE
ncbi:MAG: response regulator transcription factor [Deltaproteobacteria bacterium]|nr:response regulator transcription factor [Deltaproteobacteria bacterium]